MKRIVIFAATAALAASAGAQLPAQPNTINVEVGPGNSLTDVVRPDNKSRVIKIERNPHDHMTVTNPAVMTMGLNVDLSTVIAPPVGYDTIRVKDTLEVAPDSVGGAFRTTCGYAKIENTDPIVYPGLPQKSHYHFFMGNTMINPWTDTSLLTTTGNSTCRGGLMNRSSYWFPVLIDQVTSKPQMPNGTLVYYKTSNWTEAKGYGWADTTGVWREEKNPDGTRKFPGYATPPTGMKLLGGDPNAQMPYSTPFAYRWNCRHPSTPSTNQFAQYIAEDPVKCPVGSTIGLELFMPQCWDGVNTDSTDHRAHMAQPINVKNTGDPKNGTHKECPASHPKPLPSVSLSLTWLLGVDVRNLRLVSDVNVNNKRGITAHFDWFQGWEPEFIESWMNYCVRGQRDCHAHLIGPGADGKLRAMF